MRGLFESATAGHTILAPTAELAAALFDAVERRHVAVGHRIWPTPRIRDFDGWLREQHAQRQLIDAALPRVLGDLEERELWRAVILDSAAGKEFLEPAGAARAARRARRALAEYGIPVQALADYPTDEVRALLEWSRGFQDRCREHHCISSDQLLASTPAPAGIAWVESPIWRPVARRWLESHGALLLLPEESLAGASSRLQSASPAQELAAIADWAGERLRAAADFRAWICIPDLAMRRRQVLDAFDAALAPQRFSLAPRETLASYAVAGGTPLRDYAPVRAALDLLSAASGPLLFEKWSALLRLPELQASPADAGAAASLDVVLRGRGPDAAPLDDWLRLADDVLSAGRGGRGHAGPAAPGIAAPSVGASERREAPAAVVPVVALRRLRAALRALAAARGRHPLSRWVSVWVAAFEAAPWADRQRWSSTEFQSAERFRELLGALATADSLFGARSAESAARILQRAAQDTMFQPQTGVPPIAISGTPMDPWLAYEGLWVAGCGEERWPPPPDPIPLLPVSLQRTYGVVAANAESQWRRAADLQRRWRLRARSSVFSCADPGDGRSARWSPLLSAEPDAALAAAPLQPHWRALARRAPMLERWVDENAPAFGATERTRGIATLRAQSRCAFRGFAETRLSAAPLQRPVPGFDARERGHMLHHALEFIWSELRSSTALVALTPATRAPLLSAAALRAIEKQCERRDPGVRWRRREHPRLTVLLGKWLDTERLREPFEIEALEQGEQTAWHGGLGFTVRIDRIDRLADGGRVLIDYKTGVATADWRGERPDNPQLPVYALLRPDSLVAVAYGKVNASECGFVAEAERGGLFKQQGRPSPLEGMPNFAALLTAWSLRLDRIAGEFAAGRAEVAPTLRACASCRLQPLCRVPP